MWTKNYLEVNYCKTIYSSLCIKNYTPCYLKSTSFYFWHFKSFAINCIVLFQTGSFVNGSTKFRGALVVGNISFRSLTVTACHFVLLSSPLAYLLSNLWGFCHVIKCGPLWQTMNARPFSCAYSLCRHPYGPPWTILWFRVLGISSVENIARLGVFLFKTSSFRQ